MRKKTLLAGLIVPTLLLIGLVSFYPMFYALFVSLYETSYLEIENFIGFDNFVRIFKNPNTIRILVNTFKYVFYSLIITIPFAMLLATLLNKKLSYIGVFRTILFVPWVLSQVVTAVLWSWLLNPSYGPINYLLEEIGIGKMLFFSSAELALPTVIIVNVWWSYALPTVLILAALQTVPSNLHEAANIDGASKWQDFTHITLPIILPTIMVSTIILTLNSFNRVTLMLALTGGGPGNSSLIMSLWAYNEAFQNFRMGISSALGILIFTCNMLISVAYVRIIKREVVY